MHIDSPTDGAVFLPGAEVFVTATVVPNPATAPVEYVSFSLIDVATGDEVWFDSDDDGVAPYSGRLVVPSGDGGSYRIEVVATDQWYTSPAAVVSITASPEPHPRAPPRASSSSGESCWSERQPAIVLA